MRKLAFCIRENKDADQRLCFRYTDSSIPLLPKSEISSLQPSLAVQPGLCQTWSETPKTGFLTTRLICAISFKVCLLLGKSPQNNMSRFIRKPAFCICENKGADQLRGNREADQRLCFGFIDSTIPLLHKSEISSV